MIFGRQPNCKAAKSKYVLPNCLPSSPNYYKLLILAALNVTFFLDQESFVTSSYRKKMEEMQKVEEEERKQVCPLLGSYTPVSLPYCSHPQTLRWFTPSNLNVVHTRNYLASFCLYLEGQTIQQPFKSCWASLGQELKTLYPDSFNIGPQNQETFKIQILLVSLILNGMPSLVTCPKTGLGRLCKDTFLKLNNQNLDHF